MSRKPYAWVVLALFVGLTQLPVTARAEPEYRLGHLRIVKFWARASIGVSRPAAAYLTVINDGNAADSLVGIATPIAARVELHKTTMAGSVMKMSKVGRLTVPGRGRVEMKPGGFHVMLMRLRSPLTRGSSFALTLRFEKSGAITLQVPVLSPGSMGPDR